MTTGLSVTHFDPDEAGRFERLGHELGTGSFGLNLMVLRPGQRGRVHLHHQQEEVYIVLRGELSLLVEGETTVLGPNDAARVGPEVRRQLANAGAELCAFLAMGASGEHVSRDAQAFADWDDTVGGQPREIPLPEDIPHG